MANQDYTLKCRFSFKQAEKDHWDTEKVKAEAAMAALFKKVGEMRETVGMDPGSDADKYFMELEADSNQMGFNVTGLEQSPQPNETAIKKPAHDSTDGDCMAREIAKCKDKPHDQAVAIAAKKCGISKDSSFFEKWSSRSLNEKMRLVGMGRDTVKKTDTLIDLVSRNAMFATHQSSLPLKTDSLIEDDEYYIIDCNCFDARAKLKYLKEDGSVSIERNPPEEIEKWVLANKGHQFDLGITHEADGARVIDYGVGHMIPEGFNGQQDVSKAYIRKDALKKYPYVAEKIKYKQHLELSASYGCLDVDSVAEGFNADHHNLDVKAVVITAEGRCNAGGGTCELTP